MEPDHPRALGALELKVLLRTYQRHLLDAAARPEAHGDGRLHLVAPPGSGKTLIGLELIRRFGHPAVVFAPTTTIVEQWRRELRRFGLQAHERQEWDQPEQAIGDLVSLDPDRPAAINVFTYQRIASTAAASDAFEHAARGAWMAELVADGRVDTELDAGQRLDQLAAADARRYRTELARHRTRLRRSALAEHGASAVERFLHPNARALVDRLVASGVRTVVLDECHHLLDYWALVLAYLIERLEAAEGADLHVVGLTATLPDPSSAAAEENYRLLLGEVDFEVPTPAVVKEGELAPYRDLVRLVTPTAREQEWLDDVHRGFTSAVAELVSSPAFVDWVVSAALAPWLDEVWPTDPDEQLGAWDGFLRREPTLSVALLRCWAHLGTPWPEALPVPAEADAPMGLEDWCELLERWGLDVLATSPDPADAERLVRIRAAIAPFGLTLTERGLRQGRSPGDLLLALSQAKHTATAELLVAEHAALGDELRAVVVTDFDRMTAGPSRLGGALDDDAGSARRLLRTLVEHDGAGMLAPTLVTGTVVWVGPQPGEELAHWCNAELARSGSDTWCEVVGTDHHRTLALVGHGVDWTPRTYVPLLTGAFEAGIVRTLVGTRALLGEGWNAPRANTLVDLTGVTTSTTAQQLRGRTIRLDPSWPTKVAHNWDVVCVAPDAERGGNDLDRLRRRHDHLWGLAADDVDAATGAAAVVRGLAHLDSELAAWCHRAPGELAAEPGVPRHLLEAVNARSAAAIGDRQHSRALWQVGAPYHDRWSVELLVEPPEVAPGTRTRIHVTPLADAARRALLRAVAPVAAAGAGGMAATGALAVAGAPLAGVPVVVGLATAALLGARRAAGARRHLRRWRQGVDPAEVLWAMAESLREGLVDAGLVDAVLDQAWVEVQPVGGALEVRLGGDGVAPADSRLFVEALRALLGPVRDPRYLLTGPVVTAEVGAPAVVGTRPERDGGPTPPAPATASTLEIPATQGTGSLVRWYPVPSELGANRDRAEALAGPWRRRLGEGALVHTRSDEGRRVLLAARARRAPGLRTGAFDRWQ